MIMSNDYPQLIHSRAMLTALARDLRVRPDWHEPDEQGVTAEVHGESFDNAGYWGAESETNFRADYGDGFIEMYVTLIKDGKAVAEVNLATLFAWATGYEANDTTPLADIRAKAHAKIVAQRMDDLATDMHRHASDLRDLADGNHWS